MAAQDPCVVRRAGILLHISSLPGPWGSGDLGPEAFRFVDFLAEAGQSVWQTLPLCPTHGDGSPYQGLTVYGGNPQFISPERLIEEGWLDATAAESGARTYSDPLRLRRALVNQAYQRFSATADTQPRQEFAEFVQRHAHWLEDYALYQAFRDQHPGVSWVDWPSGLRDREPAALAAARADLAADIDRVRFEQYVFFRQWRALKCYANGKGVLLFGDMPIFVAHDSADVWAARENFELDATGHPTLVAGVPPDYFSETGQRWGNPLYRWARMEADGFRWWVARLAGQLELCDLVRIDHFRGFEAYWEIPAENETAMHGRWVRAPGDALFEVLHDQFDPLPVVAEDLGLITEEVHALRTRYHLPGMKVLQFAYEGGPGNPHLPHNYEPDMVVYTGTHDNNTSLGWYQGLQTHTREYVDAYLCNLSNADMPWPLIRCAYASVARLAIVPMQDVLMLGSAHRMNTPGVKDGNWDWRYTADQLPAGLAARLRRLTEIYGRLPEASV